MFGATIILCRYIIGLKAGILNCVIWEAYITLKYLSIRKLKIFPRFLFSLSPSDFLYFSFSKPELLAYYVLADTRNADMLREGYRKFCMGIDQFAKFSISNIVLFILSHIERVCVAC